ncbi:hypothetical protein F9817_21265 [Vibrio sp. CAIM 722]|uniref:Lipoprotein n=1 Tax=Vibrio eleionomae TaxID=2653505 RepID=A0A7X4LQE9_9VIBR|nr:hypothetical protein [Vibrio eleionomae]MZI95716.1 hypothetical protein [Vibrio eleionomae]
MLSVNRVRAASCLYRAMTITGISFILTGCFGDSVADQIRSELQHHSEFTLNGWKIADLSHQSNGYHVVISMGHNDENSYKMLYNTTRSEHGSDRLSQSASSMYLQRLRALCPDATTPEGRQFWQKLDEQKFFDMSIQIKNFANGTVAETYCKRPPRMSL